MSLELITSTKNEYVKMVRGLRQKKNRTRLLLAEGEKCVAEALRHARVECVLADDEADPVFAAAGARGASRLLVSRAVMEAISDAKTPQHVCAAVCIEKKKLPLEQGLYVALENVGDPGNVGTVIRTADAAGAKAVLLSAGCADYTSPKVIRSTMGSAFHIPVVIAEDFYGAVERIRAAGNAVLAAALDGDEQADTPENCCIMIGNESRGLTERAKELADINIRIPIFGDAESLNAGTAAAVLMYRAIWH